MTSSRREIGRVGRAHGLRGDLYVTLHTDRTERLDAGAMLYAGDRTLIVHSARPAGARWMVHFEGVDDRTAAESLVNAVLLADPLADTDDGSLWVDELIGSRVVDQQGTDRGVCVAVIDNPAHDLLELDSGALVPVSFVLSCERGVITVDVPDGLFDLQ